MWDGAALSCASDVAVHEWGLTRLGAPGFPPRGVVVSWSVHRFPTSEVCRLTGDMSGHEVVGTTPSSTIVANTLSAFATFRAWSAVSHVMVT